MTKQTDNLTKVVRHGDISLHKVDTIPEEAKLVKGGKDYDNSNLTFTLAYGETTNHFHRLLGGKQKIESTDPTIEALFTEGKFKVYETKEGVRFIEVETPTPLKHEEHRTIVIPPGIYQQMQEREEDPFSEKASNERIRTVID